MTAHYPAQPDDQVSDTLPAITLDADCIRIGEATLPSNCIESGVTIHPGDDGSFNAVTLTIFASTIDVTDRSLPHVNVVSQTPHATGGKGS